MHVRARVRRRGHGARIGESAAPVGDGRLPNFAIVDAAGREVARLLTSPFSTGAIPFMSTHTHITTPPTAFVSIARRGAARRTGCACASGSAAGSCRGGRERNVIADIPGGGDQHVVVGAHYDSVWHGPGAIDNASGVEGVRRIGEALVGRELDRGVRLVAFAAEEIKLTGSRYYVDEAKLRGELEQIAGVVNLDCIALRRAAERARVAATRCSAARRRRHAPSACSTATSSRPARQRAASTRIGSPRTRSRR